MLRKKILILSFLIPITVFSQEMGQESAPEIPIGSSGIDLAPEEEISTPTEAPAESAITQPTAAPTAPEPAPAPFEQAPAESPSSPTQ